MNAQIYDEIVQDIHKKKNKVSKKEKRKRLIGFSNVANVESFC